MSIKNNLGFTAIEIITVMIVIAIITAFVIGRAVENEPELIAQKEVLKVHLRYAQGRAMNSTLDYGIRSDNPGGNTYWLFSYNGTTSTRVFFPGEELDHIDLGALGLSMDADIIVCFNSKGVPYTDFDTNNVANLQTEDRTLTVSSSSDSENIIITKNTGFIQ
jgi:MSHA pilin protein MshC